MLLNFLDTCPSKGSSLCMAVALKGETDILFSREALSDQLAIE